MSILEDKITLAKMVLNVEDESLIEELKGLLILNYEEKFDDLPLHVKEDLKKSIEQANNREFSSVEEGFEEKHFLGMSFLKK